MLAAQNFFDEDSLAEHILSGNHMVQSVPKSLADKARSSYTNKMKTPSLANLNENKQPNVAHNVSSKNGAYFTSMQGWALSKRKTFRYSIKQKRLLMEIFLEGEERGKKASPEQAHFRLRAKLHPNEYVTSHQIRNLFPR